MNFSKLPLMTLPLKQVLDLAKHPNWTPVGKYPASVKFYPLELGTNGEFRYSYENENKYSIAYVEV